MKQEQKQGSLLERGLRWDERFNRRLGVLATGVALGGAALGAPTWFVGGTAVFAGGNFVAAELEKRAADGVQNRRIGKAATKDNLSLAA